MVRLHMIEGPVAGRSFDLEQETTLLGRALNNDIRIDDKSISRSHAMITRKDDQFFIKDLKSQNGTFVDGRRLGADELFQLEHGAMVAVGKALFSIEDEKAEEPMVREYTIDLADCRKKGRMDRLYKDRRITNRQNLEEIYEISTLLMQSVDIKEICQKIIDSLFASLRRLNAGMILLIDQPTGELKQIVSRSRASRTAPKSGYSRTVVNRVIRDGQAVMVSDTSAQESEDLSESVKMKGIKSIICAPLISKVGTRGVIYAHSTSVPQGFRRDDFYFLTAVSTPAALAIENALLYSQRAQAEEALQKAHDELEKRVRGRTAELSQANAQLRREISERKEAEERLKTAHQKLAEANKDLRLAYAMMRDWKDRLSTQLSGERIGFLLDESGRICGVTDKAMEYTKKTRSELIGKDITDLVEKRTRPLLKDAIRDAWIGVSSQTSCVVEGRQPALGQFQLQVMRMVSEGGKMLLAILRPSEKQ